VYVPAIIVLLGFFQLNSGNIGVQLIDHIRNALGTGTTIEASAFMKL
jgi:hypothetical protein